MPKIAMVGAGNVTFTKNLLTDILSYPELRESEIALMDINPESRVSDEICVKFGELTNHYIKC